MQKKALLALMLVLTMLLSSCSLIQKDPAVDAATEIIRVGDTVFTKAQVLSQVDYQMNYMASMYSMYGLNYDMTDPAVIADMQQSVVDAMVRDAVINMKVKELGLDQLTEEEQAEVKASADEYWQENRDYVKNFYLSDTTLEGEELEKAIDDQLAALGLNYDMVLESETIAFQQDKLYNHVVADVKVTDEDLKAEFDTRVADAKASYETNLSSYGNAVNNGNTVYYHPAGYRMVKQILVKYTDEDQAKIDELNSKLSAANSAVSAQSSALTGMLISNQDELTAQVTVTLDAETGDVLETAHTFAADQDEAITTAAVALASAQKQVAFYEAKLAEANETALNNIAPAADEVLAQLEAGADWDTLMAEKTEDPGMQGDTETAKNGYAVCENFTYFDSAFTAAAMGIPAVGQWSDKTAGSYGYYIVYYASDVAEGPVAMETVADEISSELLTTKQDEAYEAQITAWVDAADAKIDMKPLND